MMVVREPPEKCGDVLHKRTAESQAGGGDSDIF